MSAEYLLQVEGVPFRVTASRVDRSWGHAIHTHIYRQDGALHGSVIFGCHPEYEEFEHYQGMSTEQLISVITNRLPLVVQSSEEAFRQGIQLLIRFNSPNAVQPAVQADLP